MQVISWMLSGMQPSQAARLSCTSCLSVYRWWGEYQRTGSVWSDDTLGIAHHDKATINPNNLATVVTLILDSPEAFFGELSATLDESSQLEGWAGTPRLV